MTFNRKRLEDIAKTQSEKEKQHAKKRRLKRKRMIKPIEYPPNAMGNEIVDKINEIIEHLNYLEFLIEEKSDKE